MDGYDIVDAFHKIEMELIASMIRNMKRHRAEETDAGIEWSMWQAEQLKALEKYKHENQKKYNKKFHNLNKEIAVLIAQARTEGNMQQEIAILKAIKDGFEAKKRIKKGMEGEFFKLNERKMEALIKATTQDMEKAETAVLRMANDQYRKTIFNAQVYANTGTGTYEQAVDMATKDMLAAGLNCVQYANGARHTLSDYADMAINTASTRAYLQGEGEKRQEWGISTVILNKRGNPCPKCLPFCGKVLIDDVWSGGSEEDGKYPLMSYAISCGLYHPRCKDHHTTYFPGISTADDTWTKAELEAIRQESKIDAKRQYAARQEKRFGRLAEYSLDAENQNRYAARARQWKNQNKFFAEALAEARLGIRPSEYAEKVLSVVDKYFKKSIEKDFDSGIIKMYRKGSTHRKTSSDGNKIIDKATYHKITGPAIKKGADIRFADDEWTRHLEEQNATAVTVGDVIFFREDVTVSDVLEETHHFMQNKNGLNIEFRERERIILNEIDAKKYVLSMSKKYHVPAEEIELTKKQLESYKKEMDDLIERGEWNA